MPKANALTEVKIKNAKPKDKPCKLFDTDGLFILVHTSGGKWWRFKYRFGGKSKELSLGTYPEISLSAARQRRFNMREQIAGGIDPSVVRKAQKAALQNSAGNTFEIIAREWHEKFKDSWSSSYASTVVTRLERDVFPWLGSRPISEIEPPEVLATLRRIEARGAGETTHRVKCVCGQVFRYAVAPGRAQRDPTADLRGALKPVIAKHMAAIIEPKEVGALLRAIDGYQGYFVVKCALRLAPLVFVRPGELRHAEWAEIDLEGAIWNIKAEKMKMRQAHIVPLSRQALGILRELEPLTGNGRYAFPGGRTIARPLSNNAILAALRRMGYTKEEMSGHGFRAMARTILDEVLQVRPDFIEHQLAHAVRDPNGRAYNRTAHLEERKKMMRQWADYLDGLKLSAVAEP